MRRIVGLLATTAVLAGCGAEFQRTVPKEYRKSIRAAAKECPELTPKLLAAQIDQESGFDPDAVSPAGAEGIAQFIPDTWAVWGRDLDGDGAASPYNAAEAVDAQARLMCFLIFEARTSGIKGDEIELALAGYTGGARSCATTASRRSGRPRPTSNASGTGRVGTASGAEPR